MPPATTPCSQPHLGGLELLHSPGLDRFQLCLGLHFSWTHSVLLASSGHPLRRAIKSTLWMGRRCCALGAELGYPSLSGWVS